MSWPAPLVAHRGFHSPSDRDRRPIENSLEAYEMAWTAGVKLCECDVAVTSDGQIVLGHDADYDRLALKVALNPHPLSHPQPSPSTSLSPSTWP